MKVGVLIDMSAAIEVSFVDLIVREASGLTYGLLVAIFFSSRVG
jgi:hypothetical protein